MLIMGFSDILCEPRGLVQKDKRKCWTIGSKSVQIIDGNINDVLDISKNRRLEKLDVANEAFRFFETIYRANSGVVPRLRKRRRIRFIYNPRDYDFHITLVSMLQTLEQVLSQIFK